MIQKQISHYRLEALLGEGGMGQVYRATDLTLERPVAIKLISAHARADSTFLERFRREARLAAQLNHPSIATIYEFGEDGDNAFLAMEYVDGMTLRQLIENGPLSFEMVKKCGEQAADALSFAHQHGTVHRDIKSENLMLSKGGLIKVMDFGIARRAGDTQLTQTGQILGTPKTMAPETIKGTEPGPPADLFALGCVLYEALTGTTPFTGNDAMAVLYQITHDDPKPIRELRPDAPDYLVDIVSGMLQKDPARRYGPAHNISISLSQGIWQPQLPNESTETQPTGLLNDTTSQHSSSDADATLVSASISDAATIVNTASSTVGSTTITSERSQPGRVVGIVIAVLVGAAAIFAALQLRAPSESAAVRHAQAVELNTRGYNIRNDSLRVSIALWRQAMELDADWAVPLHNLGYAAFVAGDLRDAESWFRRALEIDSDYDEARLYLALTHEEAGRLADAELEYQAVLEADGPFAHQASNDLGYLLIQQQRYQEARAVLEPAIERWPRLPTLWKNQGLCLLALGDADRAREALDRALTLQPNNQQALDASLALAGLQGSTEALERWGSRQQEIGNPVSTTVSLAVAAFLAAQ